MTYGDMPLMDGKLVRALAHTVRQRILQELVTAGPQSPVELSHRLGEPLGNVSYHFKVLLDCGVLELVKTRPVRGALEHYYELTDDARMRLYALASVGPEIGALA